MRRSTTNAPAPNKSNPGTPGSGGPQKLAYAAAGLVFLVYALGLILSFFLPEPKQEALPE